VLAQECAQSCAEQLEEFEGIAVAEGGKASNLCKDLFTTVWREEAPAGPSTCCIWGRERGGCCTDSTSPAEQCLAVLRKVSPGPTRQLVGCQSRLGSRTGLEVTYTYYPLPIYVQKCRSTDYERV
jgi:hypothetical protein